VCCLCQPSDLDSEIRSVAVDSAGVVAGFANGALRHWDFTAEAKYL
jgi:hypothetical protein